MFSQPSRKKDSHGASEPLLSRTQEDLVAEEREIFAVEDSDDEDSALHRDRTPHTVRFEDHVQVIGPPLRSTINSREAGQSLFTGTPVLQFNP